jgi:2-oxoglutarate dehydrogenase E1 component
MSAKWLLHHRACTSRVEDMGPGTYFQRVILEGGRGDNTRDITAKGDVADASDADTTGAAAGGLLDPAQIRRVLFCSGKVFYHLYHARAALGIRDVTIIRIEQIAPFPYDLVGPAIAKYPHAELVWVQEEPKNQGAWAYVKPRFDTTLREERIDRAPIRFVGRKPSSSPASGGYSVHTAEQRDVVDRAFAAD